MIHLDVDYIGGGLRTDCLEDLSEAVQFGFMIIENKDSLIWLSSYLESDIRLKSLFISFSISLIKRS